MLSKNVETFLGCDCEYREADIVLTGAPFDSTTSFRPGTRWGSKAIRSESFGLESYSPCQNRDLYDIKVFDGGDLELPFGDVPRAVDQIRQRTALILSDNKLPVLLGGEHLVTLGAVQAVAEKYPGLHIVHFDAHADLREEYLGVELSHACVIRRCWDILGDGRIFQFGIRSGDKSEFQWGREHVTTRLFDFTGLESTLQRLEGKPVYLTVDLDVLDPSAFPGTGTPEAGGVSFRELLDAVLLVCGNSCVVGCDLVELSPGLDPSGVSTATAGKLLRELLLALNTSTI